MDQLLPRPDRARISGPKGPEILVVHSSIGRTVQLFIVRNEEAGEELVPEAGPV